MTSSRPVTFAEIKQAIEGRDARTLATFYADDALMRIIDRDNPPSKPRELKGKPAITAYFDDVCGRAMSHHIETGVSNGGALEHDEFKFDSLSS
jgi:ketosteroid isomerase-like protein